MALLGRWFDWCIVFFFLLHIPVGARVAVYAAPARNLHMSIEGADCMPTLNTHYDDRRQSWR